MVNGQHLSFILLHIRTNSLEKPRTSLEQVEGVTFFIDQTFCLLLIVLAELKVEPDGLFEAGLEPSHHDERGVFKYFASRFVLVIHCGTHLFLASRNLRRARTFKFRIVSLWFWACYFGPEALLNGCLGEQRQSILG